MELSQEMLKKVNENASNNPLSQYKQNMKGEKDKKRPNDMPERPSQKKDNKIEDQHEQKISKKEATEKASEAVSKRLNISDITDATQRVKKKGGRSRTFYMQDAMYDKLASVAEKQGIKPSQLLHAILDNVLDKM